MARAGGGRPPAARGRLRHRRRVHAALRRRRRVAASRRGGGGRARARRRLRPPRRPRPARAARGVGAAVGAGPAAAPPEPVRAAVEGSGVRGRGQPRGARPARARDRATARARALAGRRRRRRRRPRDARARRPLPGDRPLRPRLALDRRRQRLRRAGGGRPRPPAPPHRPLGRAPATTPAPRPPLPHPAGSDARQYHHLLADPELRASWRMTAFDLPAHGRSSPPTGVGEGESRLTTDRYVEAIVAVADALGLEAPVVLGCSMGGEIVLELAFRHPDRFAAAVAVQGADRVEGRQVAWAKHARVNEKLFVPEWVDGLMSPTAPPAHRAEVRWAYSQSAHGVYWGDIEFYSRDWDARERVGDIDTARCPVHILAGEYDYSCTPELARATAARIPGATFTEMRGLGHFPMAEDPRAFLAYLHPVLAELAGAGAGRV